MAETLEQVLADARGEAAVLRRHGQETTAAAIDGIVDRVKDAAEDYITWLSEADAAMRSGHHVKWLRARFAEWEQSGHARKERGRRYYRQLIVPLRANTSAAYEAGREAARKAS